MKKYFLFLIIIITPLLIVSNNKMLYLQPINLFSNTTVKNVIFEGERFSEITAAIIDQIIISEGSDYKVEITCSEDDFEKFSFSLKQGIVNISFRNKKSQTKSFTLHITIPKNESLTVSSPVINKISIPSLLPLTKLSVQANIVSEAILTLQVKQLTVSANTITKMTLSGNIDHLKINSQTIDELNAEKASITNAEITAKIAHRLIIDATHQKINVDILNGSIDTP